MGSGRPKVGQYTHERLILLCFLTRLHRKKPGYQFDQRRTYNSAVFENLMPHRTHSKIGGTREPNAAEPIPISGFREPNATERYLPRFTRRFFVCGAVDTLPSYAKMPSLVPYNPHHIHRAVSAYNSTGRLMQQHFEARRFKQQHFEARHLQYVNVYVMIGVCGTVGASLCTGTRTH